ncbi:hypothetical protein KCP75_16345 [Salmonella enterica subsp. enterica]|nr:hypothetical protein KCP75_16345 [Salmonella enterica subsp. enterica]
MVALHGNSFIIAGGTRLRASEGRRVSKPGLFRGYAHACIRQLTLDNARFSELKHSRLHFAKNDVISRGGKEERRCPLRRIRSLFVAGRRLRQEHALETTGR